MRAGRGLGSLWHGLHPRVGIGGGATCLVRTQPQLQPRSWVFVSSIRGCTSGASGSSSSTKGQDTTASNGEPSFIAKWRLPLGAAAVAAVGAGGFYWVLTSPTLDEPPEVEEVNMNIKQITEETFELHDNMFVIFLDKSEDLLHRRDDIQRLIRSLVKEEPLHRVGYYYNIRKEGDPPNPEPDGDGSKAEGTDASQPLRCVMYKGQRKSTIIIGADVPTQEILDFFNARSEKLSEALKKLEVSRVAGDGFVEDVIAASTPARPILVQQYEDTCFLCFLMRPFINSLAQLFLKHDVPLTIKRLNIERNDFPDGCPVARGTPTFVLFRGPDTPPLKWDEFKPKELVEKICKEYPKETENLFEQMDELQGLVSRRFQLFTQLVMWTVELQKLERLTSAAAKSSKSVAVEDGAPAQSTAEESESQEDSSFNEVVSEMMGDDMKRIDNMPDNLVYLQKEVDEVEHDAALMGAMLAETVRRRELAEEELFASQRV